MLRKILIILAVSLFVFGVSKVSWAMNCHGKQGSHMQLAQVGEIHKEVGTEAVVTSAPQKAEEVGNKFCPVTGEKIEEKTKATYEYQGKIYNFCCPMCIDEFKKDPQKYIKKVEEERKKEMEESVKKIKEEIESMKMEHHHEHK